MVPPQTSGSTNHSPTGSEIVYVHEGYKVVGIKVTISVSHVAEVLLTIEQDSYITIVSTLVSLV